MAITLSNEKKGMVRLLMNLTGEKNMTRCIESLIEEKFAQEQSDAKKRYDENKQKIINGKFNLREKHEFAVRMVIK